MLWDNFAFELCPASSATCGPCGVLSGWGDLGFVPDISPSLFGVYMWEGHRGHGARISSTAPSSTPAGGHPASLTPTPGSGSALPPRWPQPVLLQGACCRGLAVSPLLSPGHLEGGGGGSRRCGAKSAQLAPRRLGMPAFVSPGLGRPFSLCWLRCPSCKMKRLRWLAS